MTPQKLTRFTRACSSNIGDFGTSSAPAIRRGAEIVLCRCSRNINVRNAGIKYKSYVVINYIFPSAYVGFIIYRARESWHVSDNMSDSFYYILTKEVILML
jgi:hypothetical protein